MQNSSPSRRLAYCFIRVVSPSPTRVAARSSLPSLWVARYFVYFGLFIISLVYTGIPSGIDTAMRSSSLSVGGSAAAAAAAAAAALLGLAAAAPPHKHRGPRYTTSQWRADAVKEAFQVSWDGYYKYAFPHDSLRPVTNRYADDRLVLPGQLCWCCLTGVARQERMGGERRRRVQHCAGHGELGCGRPDPGVRPDDQL